MLLADAASDSTAVLVAQILAGSITMIASGYFALRANTTVKEAQDKAREMELRAQQLEERVAITEVHTKECESDRKVLRIDNAQLREYCSRIYRTMNEIVSDLRGIQEREIDRHPEVTDHVDLAAKIADLPPPPDPVTAAD